MKKLIIAVCTVGLCFGALAQEEKEVVDAEQSANLFAGRPVLHFEGHFGGTLIRSNAAEKFEGRLKLERLDGDQNYVITELRLNGEDIPLDKPLVGLPIRADGAAVKDFSFGLDGMGYGRQQVIYGHFYTNLFRPGAPINIELHPSWRNWKASPKLPPGHRPDSLAIRVGRYTGYYDIYRDQFNIWLPPYEYPEEYEIIDRTTGDVILIGRFNDSGTDATRYSAVNMRYENGVQIVPLTQKRPYAWYDFQTFGDDIVVTRNGVNVPARVYLCPLDGLALQIYAYGLAEGTHIEIRRPTDTGVMPVIHTYTVSKTDADRDYMKTNILPGEDAAVVTVIGSLLPNRDRGFQIEFNRTAYVELPSSGGGGGGGGVGVVLGSPVSTE